MKLAERIAALDDKYLHCRTRRHVFEDIPDDGRRNRKYQEGPTVARLSQRCSLCTTVRHEAWNRRTGDILASCYIYPADYSLSGGVRPKQVRKEYLARAAR